MKKYIALFLCFLTIFSLCSCNMYEKVFPTPVSPEPTISDTTTQNEETTEFEQTTPEEQGQDQTPPQSGWIDTTETETTEPFRYYYEIVDAYRVAAKRFDLRNESLENVYHGAALRRLAQAEPFKAIVQSAYAFYPYDDKNEDVISYERLNYFRYDDKTDLNGDGAPELVLLTENYEILAIYSYSRRRVDVDGDRVSYYYHNPLLLATFTPQEGCWIDSEGLIHVNSTTYSQSIVKHHTIYEIAQGGNELNVIAEYSEESAYGSAGPRYYKITDGERSAITKEEFDSLTEQYGKYLGRTERAEATREQSGLNRFYLYYFWYSDFSDAKFRSVFKGDKQVLVEKTGESVFLKDYVPVSGGVPLSQCDVLRYVYYDIDDDEIYEAVIDCGVAQFMLSYENGTVILKELSNARWKEIEEDIFYSYIFSICALSAPWRKNLLSREEIQTIAENIWHIEDGESTGALGTLLVYRVIVSEESDEDGYYLVTFRTEYHHRTAEEFEGCPQDGSEYHIHGYHDDYFMRIHERTGEVCKDATISTKGAQKLAEEYWGIADGQVIQGVNKTFVIHILAQERATITDAFYCLVMQVEHYEGDSYENGEAPQKTEELYHIYINKNDGVISTCPDYSGK